ncbi:f-box domain-containing protein [Stemphylium lycopersici]|uniref:F-box domain-containing protein n=1 Tax=Stemphylium lycopersici TaxID=183478 RepID=A0A364MS41_STELY|nr:f-box domain-containing protein [Stemphylium lycopersici]RAR01450.1 f-box domain-containing protein [Stemphylium lycopersici]
MCTKPPKPLPGFSELQMWQLAWSRTCQFCNKLDSHTPGDRIWQKGPGHAGVRVIWPFAIRACGPCLLQRCQTDASLLFSAASALRPALPFALVTSDQHYIPAYTLHTATLPPDVEIAKYYYKKHVDDISRELSDALGRGPAAAEEWSKGLDARGKERIRAAENWERWEVKQQCMEEQGEAKRAASAAPSHAATSHSDPSKSPPQRTPSPIIHAPVPASKYASAVSFAAKHGDASRHVNSTPPVPNLTAVAPSSQHAQARPPTVPPQAFTPSGQRNLHDANEAKATRKSDIERRCQQMDPPIAPNILRHMDSFKAAIQISQPMNDFAWSVLQPRLIAQLPAAQQAEADHVSRAASLPTKTPDRRHLDANSKEAREVMDREWEEAQRPIRDRLDAIADDFINRDWDHGQAVTYENSPKFAADLLAYVRRTFYSQKVEPDAARLAASVHPPTDHAESRPKLVLDNMKWVYDNKIKPLTEQFRKDIFLCYGNGCEHNNKYYGFEGVTQHYGAKHTAAFSSGNVVVAWREAEWPEETPFHPDPSSVKVPPHSQYPPASTSGYGGYYGGYSRAGTATPHMPTHLPQASPGPYNYANQYAGPFPPPQMPSGTMTGLEYPQTYAAPVDMYAHQAMGPPGYAAHAPQNPYLTSPAMINNAIAPPPPSMPPPGHGFPETAPNGTEDTGQSTSSFDKQVSTVIDMAQDLWKRTSGIKDMPNSVRIYVLLHRVISKFHVEFNHEPNLNHFIDALSNYEMPKALKNAPGLSCKACQVGSVHHMAGSYYSKSEERTTYTVLGLLQHFRTQHLPYQQPIPGHGVHVARLDWKENMIELPSERFISGLIHAPGMDDEKLLMIATVFPSLFPMPLPKIGVIDSHGLASPASSGPKDAEKALGTADAPGETGERSTSAAMASTEPNTSLPAKPPDTAFDAHRPILSNDTSDATGSLKRNRSYRDSSPGERRQHHYAEPRYYMPRDHLDDGYHRPREYVEYAPSPRIIHAGPAYDDYTGRRTAFREQERYYGPPEDIVYAHPREGSHGSREYSAYPRQVRYYDEDDQRPEYRYMNERQSRDASPPQGQAAADKFLAENEPPQHPPPQPEAEPPAPVQEHEEGTRYTPPPSDAPAPTETNGPIRPLGPPHPRAPSTVSNGSRYDEYHSEIDPMSTEGNPDTSDT